MSDALLKRLEREKVLTRVGKWSKKKKEKIETRQDACVLTIVGHGWSPWLASSMASRATMLSAVWSLPIQMRRSEKRKIGLETLLELN